MAHIRLDKVNLKYPIRKNKGLFLKEFFLHGFFLKKNTLHIHALRDVTLDGREGGSWDVDADPAAVLAAVAWLSCRPAARTASASRPKPITMKTAAWTAAMVM